MRLDKNKIPLKKERTGDVYAVRKNILNTRYISSQKKQGGLMGIFPPCF